jgi:putative salt-induced outer membrane protein YdiY
MATQSGKAKPGWTARRCAPPLSFLAAVWLLAPLESLGADIIVLSNGDQLKGEIKKREKDVITISTDYSDEDFKIKWEKVTRIESDRTFLVETFEGVRVAGTIKPDPTDTKAANVGTDKVALQNISYVLPFERTFWSRFDAGFDLGYSMTKANGVKQFTGALNVVHTGERSIASLAANAFLNSQSNAPRTRRWEVSPEYRYLFGRSWYANGAADFYSSEEQQLALRTTLAGGIGRYFLRSPVQYLAVGGGLAWTRERYYDPEVPSRNSAEAYGGVEYMSERLKFADLITRFTIYPSLTISGRYRTKFQFDLSFNLPGDWYMDIGYYSNFDSKPPGALPRSDYGWKNTFGYKF